MFASRVSRVGAWMVKELCKGKYNSAARMGYLYRPYSHYLQPLFKPQSGTKIFQEAIFQRHHKFSTTTADNRLGEGDEEEEEISVTFVDKRGEEHHIKVPVGMSMLEAALENDIELEGACGGSLACSTCHVIVMDMEYYNKLEDVADEENDMLDLAFGLTHTSRLGCQVIASPELDGIRFSLPSATHNFAVDRYIAKQH